MRFALVVLVALGGCRTICVAPSASPPSFLLGAHVDDYDLSYVVTSSAWTQTPGGRYHVSQWWTASDQRRGYLIAQNDTANTADGGRWTRIDWVQLDDQGAYAWAYCLSAYDAVSAQAAEASTVTDIGAPRTGCNGYPFSRMRRPAAP